MKNIIKILIGISIIFLLMGAVSAAINCGLKAPYEFEHSKYWEKNDKSDVYSLKNNDKILLYVQPFDDDFYNTLFKDDPDFDYHVNSIGDNIFMGKDNSLHDGYVMEVIEYNGEKYIVDVDLTDNPTNAQLKDSMKYLTEFNELNNVKPIKV